MIQNFLYHVSLHQLLIYLAVINFLTFAAYGLDKRYSRQGSLRISEKTLLLLGFFGGTPAAFIAQSIFRHKTKKRSFRVKFWIIFIIQIVGLAIIATKFVPLP